MAAIKQKQSFSELKVGIFVLIACSVLAVAIFTIGSRVGLFQETFWATTYLNNVSGLKAGDIVTLGGVEVGNVDEVRISEPMHIPETDINRTNLEIIQRLEQQVQPLQPQVLQGRQQLAELRAEYTSALTEFGPGARQVRDLRSRLDDMENLMEQQTAALTDLQNDLKSARRNLQNIQIYMKLRAGFRDWIKADSSISLGSIGLLGDKYIEISLGRTDVPPTVIREEVDGWISTTTREVVLITGTPEASFDELITGANEILANFKTLSQKMEDIMTSFEEGEGSIGKFFTDPSFYNNLNQTVVDANVAVRRAADLLQDVTQGPGTIPHLIQDKEVYDRIAASTARLQEIVTRIEQGEGSIGRLINDPAFAESTERTMASLEEITRRIEAGEGTFGKLSKDEQFYQDLQSSVDKLSLLLADIEQGKGTMGRLMKDEQLYGNVNQFFSEVVKLIYDFRQDPKKFLTIQFRIF